MTPQTGQGAHFAPQLIGTPAHPHHMPATTKASVSGLPGKQTEAPIHPPTHPCPENPPPPHYPYSKPSEDQVAPTAFALIALRADVAWQYFTQEGQSGYSSVVKVTGRTAGQSQAQVYWQQRRKQWELLVGCIVGKLWLT